MKPKNFTGTNVVFAKDQPQYLPLPAYRSYDGIVVTQWSMSFKERVKALFLGRIQVVMLTFNKPLQPIKLEVK